MVRITGPLFSGNLRGTVGGNLTFRRGRHGPEAIKTKSNNRRNPTFQPTIRACFKIAKATHSSLPEDDRPTWSEFWLQWLIDFPECVTGLQPAIEIWADDFKPRPQGTPGAPETGIYQVERWARFFRYWERFELRIIINGVHTETLEQRAITSEQLDPVSLEKGDTLEIEFDNNGWGGASGSSYAVFDPFEMQIFYTGGVRTTQWPYDGEEPPEDMPINKVVTYGPPVGWETNGQAWGVRVSRFTKSYVDEVVGMGGSYIEAQKLTSPVIDGTGQKGLIVRWRNQIEFGSGDPVIISLRVEPEGDAHSVVWSESITSSEPPGLIQASIPQADNKEFRLVWVIEAESEALTRWAIALPQVLKGL